MAQTLLHSENQGITNLPSRVLCKGEKLKQNTTTGPMSRIQEVTLSTKES